MKRFPLSLLLVLLLGATATQAQVSVVSNYLKFNTLADYEDYANGVEPVSTLENLASNSGSFTSMYEQSGGVEDTLYPPFVTHVLNTDHIAQVGPFLVKIDVENNKGLAIAAQTQGAYSKLVNNDYSATGMFNFTTEDDLAIEVLEKVVAGELNTSTYRGWIDNSTTSRCRSSEADKLADLRIWDEQPELGFCNNNTARYGMDNKVVYQKLIFYFSLQSKVKSLKACTYSNWITVPSYRAQLRLQGTAKFRRVCDPENNRSANLTTTGTELSWRPYEGSRRLSHYDFSVSFGADHPDANPVNYFSVGPYRIKSGY